ncbi:unnamed protein product [Trichogramma brassicae]|uniref:Uncharacterized protein n=1 Tax=Trichogramma brassicae TaxID=86971 RepID=A0A6H5IPC4_9HYME|nr:unnamed protein product [Trichogramma brassicae]
MSSSSGRSDEQRVEHPKLEELKRLRKMYFLTLECHRDLFRHDFGLLITDWKERLPNLLDILTKQEMDWLLEASIESPDLIQKIVDFFIRCGYKDEPDLDEDGKPLLRRTTSVHRIAVDKIAFVNSHRTVDKIELLRKLFKIYDNFHVNYTDESGYTHFHAACKCGLEDVAKKFLDRGQDPSCVVPKTGDSPLHLALKNNKKEVSKLLLRNGANLISANSKGKTPLHLICNLYVNNGKELAEMLFKFCDEKRLPVKIDARDDEGNTPLHAAIFSGSIDLVEVLLRRGANPTLANDKGKTPLHVICPRNGNVGLSKLFELNDELQLRVPIDARDNEGSTPLHLATSCGNEELVERLLRRGADPTLANAEGRTPLHYVAERSRGVERFFRAIEDTWHTVQIDARDSEGDTPLLLALKGGHDVQNVRGLLRRGADPSLANKDGKTPLHVICQRNENRVLLRLFFEIWDAIENRGQVDARDNEGSTPLHLATSRGNAELVEWLLRRGANPCLANAKGLTPLHYVAKRGSGLERFFRAIKDTRKTVQIDARDNEGRTALEWAVASCCPPAVASLLERGADLSNFVFPTATDFDEYGKIDRSRDYVGDGPGRVCTMIKPAVATGLLAIVELLEPRLGHELDLGDALKIMGFFDKYKLYESEDFSASKDADDLADSILEEMAKKSTYMDHFEFASSYTLFELRYESMEACALRLKNMALIKCCFDAEGPDFFDSVLSKCTDPGCCCWCCSALRPRYKRLVDNIFPVNPQDGLIKNNMEKLMFYSLSSPEKLDRIGEYLFQRASRDISRRRNGFVIIAMEAMDQLLAACHAQTLNLFVESFLKMVQKLLESTDPQLQILATQSFVRFANIEEDTPSYHTRYDFFVSKYSSMCHSNNDDPSMRKQIRLAGIQGLQGVVRKTVSDDLVENIWNMVHMEKIVPSLLYNMQNSRYSNNDNITPESPTEERSDPPQFAETCMRELVGRASFGHIKCVIKPVLNHLDNHQLWVPNYFAIHTFRIVMFSIQSQYSYTVVEALMTHLDEHSQSSPKIRTSIADTLSKIISIAAGESVGPSVLEIISSLLTHLRVSVSRNMSSTNDEQLYQEVLINALGEFANHLPDYQKIEIMKFIMGKVPYADPDSVTSAGKGDVLLQSILLKSLLKVIFNKFLIVIIVIIRNCINSQVGTKYQTIHLNTTFPPSFLQPLLRMSLASDSEMRLLVHQIFHTLIDRHKNSEKLSKPTVSVVELDLAIEKATRPDVIFIRKHGPEIYSALHESLGLINNRVENIESIYTTVALLIVELCSEETVLEMLRLVMSLQDIALTNAQISIAIKFNLHVTAISLLVLIANVCNITTLIDYANKHEVLQSKLSDIFNNLMIEHRSPPTSATSPPESKLQTPAYELHFPEMFVC